MIVFYRSYEIIAKMICDICYELQPHFLFCKTCSNRLCKPCFTKIRKCPFCRTHVHEKTTQEEMDTFHVQLLYYVDNIYHVFEEPVMYDEVGKLCSFLLHHRTIFSDPRYDRIRELLYELLSEDEYLYSMFVGSLPLGIRNKTYSNQHTI